MTPSEPRLSTETQLLCVQATNVDIHKQKYAGGCSLYGFKVCTPSSRVTLVAGGVEHYVSARLTHLCTELINNVIPL